MQEGLCPTLGAILAELVEVERGLVALEGKAIKAAKEREFDRLESPVEG